MKGSGAVQLCSQQGSVEGEGAVDLKLARSPYPQGHPLATGLELHRLVSKVLHRIVAKCKIMHTIGTAT